MSCENREEANPHNPKNHLISEVVFENFAKANIKYSVPMISFFEERRYMFILW
jgi:hypothetical protein